MTHSDRHTLILGAGLTGLATAGILQEADLPVTVLEAAEQSAWTWRARHPALRLNIHRHFAALPGKPAPREDGAFMTRDRVVQHLADYAETLAPCIRTGISVTEVTQTPQGWCVTGSGQSFDAPHLVICTGRDRVPHIPRWRGLERFQGQVLHAADLGDVAAFDGKRVLVVGAGNSGSDVLNHLARHNPAEVRISVRHGPAIVPQRVLGLPLHRAASLFAALPLRVVDPAFALTQRLFFGDLTRFGLTSHSLGGGTRLARDGTAFAIDDGFVAAIRTGRFKVMGEVVEFWTDRVSFDDFRSYEPEVMICATGYRTGLSPLLGHLGVLDATGIPRAPQGTPVPGCPGLWFNGFKPAFQGYFHAAAKGARRIARGIKAAPEARPTAPHAQSSPLRLRA